MICLIDNYDSFSYNLFQMVGALHPDIRVLRNDAVGVEELAALRPEAIILSPGPGRPDAAGICEAVVTADALADTPLLGVCLGHQAICEALGSSIVHADQLMHGKQSAAEVDGSDPLFAGLASSIQVGRYHSLAVNPDTLPACLKVTARADDGAVMAVRHVERPVHGLQFHPESILTPQGPAIVKNFLLAAGILPA